VPVSRPDGPRPAHAARWCVQRDHHVDHKPLPMAPRAATRPCPAPTGTADPDLPADDPSPPA